MRRRRRRRIEQYKNLNQLCSDFFLFARRIKKKNWSQLFLLFLFTRLVLFLIIFLRLFYSRQTYTGGLSYIAPPRLLFIERSNLSNKKRKRLWQTLGQICFPYSTISSPLSMFVFWNRQSKHVSQPCPFVCVCVPYTHTHTQSCCCSNSIGPWLLPGAERDRVIASRLRKSPASIAQLRPFFLPVGVCVCVWEPPTSLVVVVVVIVSVHIE